MLWKKESPQPDELYIDIFTPNTQHWDSKLASHLMGIVQAPHPQKSDAIALQKRNEGNEKFRKRAWLQAMESYNDSLRYANPDTEHISLAYANRAACFLKLKMYDECLADIELAKKAGYPEHLRPKLDERKTMCQMEKQGGPQRPCVKLSIDPNEKFPSLSKTVKVQRDENGVFSMVAMEDIDVGQPIAVEVPYRVDVWLACEMYCNICSKEFCNLVPCKKCATAMFCPECHGNFLHEHECGLSICGESDFNSGTMSSVRDVLLVLKLLPSVDELMSFVEQMLKNPSELPESLLDNRSKYQAYFNCPLKKHDVSFDEMKTKIYATYKTLQRIPHVNEMFKTAKHRRFLMHLIGHHMKIPELGAGMHISGGSQNRAVHIILAMLSYSKLSCVSNVLNFTNGGKTIWYSSKPIKKGEQLVISCAPCGNHSTEKRKKMLLDVFKINCECSRCQGKTASLTQRQLLVSDPAFRYIQANMSIPHPMLLTGARVKLMMDACATVLRRYGQLNYCDELAFILKNYHTLYQIQLSAGGRDFDHPFYREILRNFLD